MKIEETLFYFNGYGDDGALDVTYVDRGGVRKKLQLKKALIRGILRTATIRIIGTNLTLEVTCPLALARNAYLTRTPPP